MDTLDLAKIALSRSLVEMGYTKSMASELVNGKKRPSLSKAAEIERELGIPAASWAAGVPLQEMWNHMKVKP